MQEFEYVSKTESAPVKNQIIAMIHEAQDILRNDFTFRYDFIGSSSRNMITRYKGSNIGYDFDINVEVNDDEDKFSPKEIKTKLMQALNQVIRKHCFNKPCEDSTRVITIKKVDFYHSRIEFSCDIAIVNHYTDSHGNPGEEYIRFNKAQNSYSWKSQPSGYHLEEKVTWLRKNGHWGEVRELYLEKKNRNEDPSKHSRSLYAEAVNEICLRHGYHKS